MAHPGQVGIRIGQRPQHLLGAFHYPGSLRAVRVLAAQAQRGAAGQLVEGGADGVAAGHRQFVRAQRGEAFLGVDIEAGDLAGTIHGNLRLTGWG